MVWTESCRKSRMSSRLGRSAQRGPYHSQLGSFLYWGAERCFWALAGTTGQMSTAAPRDRSGPRASHHSSPCLRLRASSWSKFTYFDTCWRQSTTARSRSNWTLRTLSDASWCSVSTIFSSKAPFPCWQRARSCIYLALCHQSLSSTKWASASCPYYNYCWYCDFPSLEAATEVCSRWISVDETTYYHLSSTGRF